MSLTGQILRGELGRWCAATFVGTPAAVDQVVRAARASGRRPVRPSGDVPAQRWADVGGAFGQRLADIVDPAPPYGALLGLVRAGWMSWKDAHAHAATYPSHSELSGEHRERALSMRRTPDGWMDLGPTRDVRDVDQAAAERFGELLERTRAYQTTHAPAGAVATAGVEAGLARSAWVLGACEGVHRSGEVDERLVNVLRNRGRAAELRALATEPVVAELVELAQRFADTGLEDFRQGGIEAPGLPLGVAAPTIVPRWADGDLLIGPPPSTTLVDVKTVISLTNTERVAHWLWQVLLYAWLDTLDLHHIRAAGLYLARHGVLITWPVDELAGLLLGDTAVGPRQRAHRAFLALATEVIRAEGGVFPVA